MLVADKVIERFWRFTAPCLLLLLLLQKSAARVNAVQSGAPLFAAIPHVQVAFIQLRLVV
jgi:hypothetical protein